MKFAYSKTIQARFLLERKPLSSLGLVQHSCMEVKMENLKDTICKEVARRKTFAIISHPDAGKTTLTEKLLLYGGAIRLAGCKGKEGKEICSFRLDGD